MISSGEIEAAARRMDVHVADVQRDYVYGWLIKAINADPYLGPRLILKGGTCLRKVYLPESRFSSDLDFSAGSALDEGELARALGRCCAVLQEHAGICFDHDRTNVAHHRTLAGSRDLLKEVYRARVYFADFYGETTELTIGVQLDVTSFDVPVLGERSLPLLHPYSDATSCHGNVRCLALEELIAAKLKCMLQRRHVLDLFDAAYAYLWRNEMGISRANVVRAFARKTIFASNLGSAREILLGLPAKGYEESWSRSITCPAASRLGLDRALNHFRDMIQELFEGERTHYASEFAFFPAEFRYPILQAGATHKLLRLTYDGISRLVEPYALLFKQPEGGAAREYFYCWNLEGGSSGPGWRSLVGHKISRIDIIDEREFEPRTEIQLSKAGEMPASPSFRHGKQVHPTSHRSVFGAFHARTGIERVVQCPYCQKKFKRATSDTTLRPHKSPDGYPCAARQGYWV